MEYLDAQTLEPGEALRIERAQWPEEGYARKFLYRLGDAPAVNEVLLVHADGEFHALDSLCPHAGGRLAEGPLIDGTHAHCPLHLYRFRPRDGEPVGVICPPATSIPVRREGDVLRVDVPWVESETT